MMGERTSRPASTAYPPVWGQNKWVGVFGRISSWSATSTVGQCTYNHINSNAYACGATTTVTATQPYAWVWSSEHTGGAHFVLADGSVRFLSQNLDETVFVLANLIADGRPVGDF